MLDPEELETFRDVTRDVLADRRPSVKRAALADLWPTAAEQGWLSLSEIAALDALLAVLHELGRVASPLPVADAYVAATLLADRPDIVTSIAAADLRLAVLPSGDWSLRHVEAAESLTHVLLLDCDTGEAMLRTVDVVRLHAGLPDPAWGAVGPGAIVAEVSVGPDTVADALTLMRLAMAARIVGAVSRTHELALEHARVRRQFGRSIGSFQAVAHRVVDTETILRSASGLIADAQRRCSADDPTWKLATELAVTYVRETAARAQFSAHHTLGAVGYFEEHDGPWLFRRVHADLTRLRGYATTAGEAADRLVDAGEPLPPIEAPGDEDFRKQIRDLIARELHNGAPAVPSEQDRRRFVSALADAGLLRAEWPTAHGGRNASVTQQLILREELVYANAPIGNALGADALVAGAILQHGTEAQRSELLPRFARDELRVCLGYSESESGSDLASMRTRAVRDADGWRIDGQKAWTTNAHVADAIWLAVRTSSTERPHDGVTMFLVPMDTPGITVQQHRALSGEISCTVFLDDVAVPDTMRVGEVDRGWSVIVAALADERVVMGARVMDVLRLFNELVALLRAEPAARAGPRGSDVRGRLGRLAARIHAARTLVAAAVAATKAGRGVDCEAPMAKIVAAELAEEFGTFALDVLGPGAALAAGDADALGQGMFQQGLRLSPMYVIGGGTNDIQRNLLARGLGLPRD